MKILKPCANEGSCLEEKNCEALKRCRACRLNRCIEGGMNPLCVVAPVSPTENPLVQHILRQRKQLQCISRPSTSGGNALPVEITKPPEVRINRLIDELAFLEKAHERIRRSRFSPSPDDGISLAELLREHSKLANDYGEMPAVTTLPISQARTTMCPHKPRHGEKSPCLCNFSKVWPYADIVYAIEYVKTFQFFHRLSEEEQSLLTRWSISIAAHLATSYYSYKMKSNVTYHPDGTAVRMDCIAELSHKWEFHYESVARIRTLEIDEKEYALLKAIIVCDHMVEGISDSSRAILEEQRALFAKSLFSYMNAKRGPHKAPGQFVEMLKLIDWLRGVNERRKDHHLLRSAKGLRPWYCKGNTEDKLRDELFLSF